MRPRQRSVLCLSRHADPAAQVPTSHVDAQIHPLIIGVNQHHPVNLKVGVRREPVSPSQGRVPRRGINLVTDRLRGSCLLRLPDRETLTLAKEHEVEQGRNGERQEDDDHAPRPRGPFSAFQHRLVSARVPRDARVPTIGICSG